MRPIQEYRLPAGGCLLIEVEDVDGLAERVAERGAEIMQPIRDWSSIPAAMFCA